MLSKMIPSLEEFAIKQIIEQAETKQLLQLLDKKFDELINEFASTATGRARLLQAASQKATTCETHFPEYESMRMDMTTTDGSCERMKDRKTGITFTWCPHWGGGSGYRLDVEKDKAFKQKGMALGFAESIRIGLRVSPNPIDKKLLLDLCESEGMDPEALACLNLLLEQKWFQKSNKHRRTE